MAIQVEDLVNQALRDGGIPLRINDIYEGSEAAKTALELYSQARQELLRVQDWSFNRRTLTLTLLKGPPPAGGYTPLNPWTPIYPFPGFLFEYAYPDDCLDMGGINPPPGITPDLDPQPARFRIDNDEVPIVSGTPPVASGPQAKVILCNVSQAIGTYRADVTDPALWEPGFTATLVSSLGRKFAVAFGVGGANERQLGNAEAARTAQTAGMVRG